MSKPLRTEAAPGHIGPDTERPRARKNVNVPADKRAKAAKGPAAVETAPSPVRPPVGAEGLKPRHHLLALSFLLLVMLPTALTAWYMWNRAEDRFVSSVAFSVRQENAAPSVSMLGGLSELGLGGGSASDSDILYDFLQSQDLVARLDDEIDLRTRFARAWPADRMFAFNPAGSLEELSDYWRRHIQVLYDDATHLITVHVAAFTPEDALTIAHAAFDESSRTINRLSDVAREDATRYARDELGITQEKLTEARQAMTEFRMRTLIVDPAADLEGQMGVLGRLQGQLAEALVALDTLRFTATPDDIRIQQAENRIDAIRWRISEERAKFGAEGEGPGGESYAQLMGEYEKLAADLEFAETAYRSARAAYDTAQAQAQRQSRYLAAHIEPRLAQISTRPDRPVVVAAVFGGLLLGWAVLLLVYYSLRDRR